MSRNLEAEIDNLRAELAEIKVLLCKQTQPKQMEPISPPVYDPSIRVYKCRLPDADPRIQEVLDQMADTCNEQDGLGRVMHLGVFSSGGRQSTWAGQETPVEDLLALIENDMAGRVLACIGNNDRLRLLLAILRAPRTVAELVEDCDFSSTGQVYHHLKPLIAADLVTEDSENEGRGKYVIQPHRVSGILILLAGIADMLDTRYTHGKWE